MNVVFPWTLLTSHKYVPNLRQKCSLPRREIELTSKGKKQSSGDASSGDPLFSPIILKYRQNFQHKIMHWIIHLLQLNSLIKCNLI